jgi:4-oxalocrotonate tautomerase
MLTVADLLGGELNLRRENLLISLVEVNKESWSLGNGEMQYGPARLGPN